MRRTLQAVLAGSCLIAVPAKSSAADSDPKGIEFFEKKIRPVLVQNCYQCHSAEAKKPKGGLLLDTRDGIRKGGDNGPAVVPGKVQDSLLLKALRHDGPKMPPKDRLPDTVLADFVRWVQMGAPDPRDGSAVAKANSADKGNFWAFQPPRKPALPPVKDGNWARGDIDHFILAGLEARGLKPVTDADRLTLLRRVSFDLTGLPPGPEEVDAFLKDSSARAFEQAVDRLLASPRFGERWGRHWLDVARYAESNGNADNVPFPHAWRYRDYVIASFNQDKPYDQFVREQVAGDLLPAGDPKDRNEHLTATGFLALGSKPRAQNNPNFEMDLVADQIEVATSAILGLTVACARCHDHKFDPIPTKDYYALAGIFTSTQMLFGTQGARGAAGQRRLGNGGGLHELAGETDGFAMGVRDRGQPGDCRVCIRGESANRGETVPRGFLSAVSPGQTPKIDPRKSGRLELAQWLTAADHPLTARVMVNRVWHHLFGSGLVRSVDNFGTLGERPSYPELLDHLAVWFVEDGWSVKRLIRAIVLSHTYQLSSGHDAGNLEKDPANQYLWRATLRRLEAEAVRDAALAVSGQLQHDPPRGTTATFGGNRRNPAAQRDHRYRSVYLPIVRNSVPEVLSVFDFVDTSLIVGSREVTTVPAQALYLMNSPFMVEQARHAAQRLLSAEGLDDAGRVELAYKTALSRPPTAAERERAVKYLAECVEGLRGGEKDMDKARASAWASFCQALLASAEFRYLN